MDTRAQALYVQVKEAHGSMYAQIKQLETSIKTCNDMHELADYTYALRECYRFIDDLRKEFNLIKELSERLACLIWTKDSDGDSIKTKFCTGTPHVKLMTSIPSAKTKPEEYNALMDYLGVPLETRGVVKPHWPSFVDMISARAEKGEPLPPGLDPNKTYPVYSLSIRAKKDIEE